MGDVHCDMARSAIQRHKVQADGRTDMKLIMRRCAWLVKKGFGLPYAIMYAAKVS